MTNGRSDASRSPWLWTELFRTFQVALDPKKLLLAAVGIFVVWLGTYALSFMFFSMKNEPLPSSYKAEEIEKKRGIPLEQARKIADDEYQRDLAQYQFTHYLAGRSDPTAPEQWKHAPGTFRVAPWNEDRGPNPFMLITGGYREGRSNHRSLYESGHFWEWLVTKQSRVLIEPLVKFLKPIIYLLSPRADLGTRLFLLVVTFWTMAVWAFFGGVITRIAVVQLADRDGGGLVESMRFVAARYAHYLAAPLVPLLFIAGITLIMMVFALFHLIPVVGDIVDGILWPIPILLGFAQALLLVGLVGYPLMYSTISTEGSDTFDALSRSYNYVYQAPWQYLWNGIVAIAYGMVVVFFVAFMGSMVVYLAKWGLGQGIGTEYFSSRRIENLFIYAPESYDWHNLLVDRPELKSYAAADVHAAYKSENLAWYNYISATLVGLWTTLILLFVVGYGYSYFFTASTMIYLIMRHTVDDTDIDEVYADDDMPDEAFLPPTPPAAPDSPQTQMVDAPTLRTPPPEPPKPA